MEIELRRQKLGRSICWATCFSLSVYFFTMAPQAGREIMNGSEVAGSIPTVIFPRKKKGKREYIMFKNL